MQVIMQPALKRNFAALLTHPHFTPRDILERDFDEDVNRKPVTAEPLDWEFTRHWPALATD